MHPDIISFRDVGLRYGRGPEVLSDVNLSLPQGSFTFLTGPSGAGKSSLLKLCYLALAPSRGQITAFGHDAALLSNAEIQAVRRRIGVVLQDFTLIDHLNVFENVALPLRVVGQSRADYSQDVIELLQWVGLGHRLQAFPSTLSGGEKQRAAIARAVIAKPNLLIADEPTGNVDPEIGRRLLRLFAEMNRVGTTVMIATHDIHLIQELDARVLRIENGRVFKGLNITATGDIGI
ncbi:cell division transport system ATP-binding protein [Litorimonas taeanensis]|uniref:Cell division ATP-binding protein FtsE n=1 Tax=Litorimonas taeanensis TaxID=568099 RepID=A0A420WCX9_9PROT|nr:cell division ATP-binding protein FtsE [Litorimonas taeanensis]RKQ68879.1 cell division transport system ATP-binding protein [Litorimonas taeanensis]